MRLDGSNGLIKNSSNATTKTADQPPKTPWYLRFTESFDPRGFAQVVGVGMLYGLLFAGLLLAPLPFTNQTTHAHHLGASAGLHPEAPPKEELGQMWMMPCGAMWYKTPSAPFANDGIPGRMIVGVDETVFDNQISYFWAVASPVFPCEDADKWEHVMREMGQIGRKYQRGVDSLNRRINVCYGNCSKQYGIEWIACLGLTVPKAILICQGIVTLRYYSCLDDCRDTWWLDYYDLEDELENAMDDIVYPAVE